MMFSAISSTSADLFMPRRMAEMKSCGSCILNHCTLTVWSFSFWIVHENLIFILFSNTQLLSSGLCSTVGETFSGSV